MEVVSSCKYLGVTFAPFLSWSTTQKTQVAQAEKNISLLKRMFKSTGLRNVKQMFELFDRIIVPILCYGSEIWGTKRIEYVERVQSKFCKYILGVNSKTSNVVVLGECGRWPLACVYIVRCISYWIKLLNMPNQRYPKNIYNMLYNLDNNGRHTWVSDVKSLLCTFGFGYVWLSQTVGDISAFMFKFKQTIKDCFMQNWESDIHLNHKLQYYKNFKGGLYLENYVMLVSEYKYRKALAKLRCSAHRLNVEVSRYKGEDDDSLCNYCLSLGIYVLEDEYHFIMQCPKYSILRTQYISQWIILIHILLFSLCPQKINLFYVICLNLFTMLFY